ncbi:MAG: hypothetical protein AB7E55_16025 [Pigmentiphaga sp.]
MTEAESRLRRLLDDFTYYAPNALRIRDKRGRVVPFELNSAQILLHEKVEAQLSLAGKIRALVLKGRQQGISTYVEGRFYHKTSTQTGKRAVIMTHEAKATANLFSMAKLYHACCPGNLRPTASKDNANELVFGRLMSAYKVLTAGASETGRGDTAQLFHASEFGFWANAAKHMAGIGQAVPDMEGTEVFIESTANGVGNPFHSAWQDAEAGLTEYIPVFLPWFMQTEYRREPPEGFVYDTEEAQYATTYDLDEFQMAWRRNKIRSDFKGDVSLFNQEYPASPELAFIRAGGESYINQALVAKARKHKAEARGAKVLGIDPAEFGSDRSAFVLRQGLRILETKKFSKLDLMELVGHASMMIHEENPDAVFVDAVGVGAGVYSRLAELFPNRLIIRVHSGAAAFDKDTYANVRAEMWGNMREWFTLEPQIPDSDEFAADLCAPGYSYDSARRVLLESKEKMKSAGVRSPDFADALAMTFFMPVEVRTPEMSPLQQKLAGIRRRQKRSAMAA